MQVLVVQSKQNKEETTPTSHTQLPSPVSDQVIIVIIRWAHAVVNSVGPGHGMQFLVRPSQAYQPRMEIWGRKRHHNLITDSFFIKKATAQEHNNFIINSKNSLPETRI